MQFLLEKGANLEAKDEDGAIPLHDACAGGWFASFQCIHQMLVFAWILHTFL